MFKTNVRGWVAVVMCLCLASSQTSGGWDVGILRAANKVVEDTPQQDPNPLKENTPPTISKIVDRTIAPHSVVTASFLVNDTETPAGALKVSVTNDQRDIVADDRMEISGTGVQRTLTIRPLPNKEGTANVTVSVVDGGGLQTKVRFGLTVTTDLPYVPGEVIVRYKEEDGRASGASLGIRTLSAGTASVLGVKSTQPLLRPVPSKASASALTSNRKSSRVLPGGAELASQSLNRLERTYVVTFDVNRDIQDVMEALRRDPNVESVEWNQKFSLAVVNDPFYVIDKLWGMKRINAQPAWDNSPKGEGVVVAVLDTGVDIRHEDLASNIWVNLRERRGDGIDNDGNGFVDDINGWDFVGNDNNPSDYIGHGTHVAGTIAAVGENGIGVIGVAPKAKIMVLKGISDEGKGDLVGLINGLYYATNNGADVINNSWGANVACQEPYTKALLDAINYAHGRGVVVVAGAGNGDQYRIPIDVNGFSPAGCPNVIAVSATNSSDQKASFSNYGNKIDVAAPGVGIMSTVPGGYASYDGTSMACPHVAGVVALIMSKNPVFNSDQVTQQIFLTATDLGKQGFDPSFGYGLINAQKSLNAINLTDAQPPTQPGSPQMLVISNKRLELRWSASSDNERVQGYVVEFSTQSDFSSFVSRDASNSNSFQLTSLVPGKQYYARVSAYDLAGNRSVYSDVVSASTMLSVSLPNISDFILSGSDQGYLIVSLRLPTVFQAYEVDFSIDKNFRQLVPEEKIEILSENVGYSNIFINLRARDLNPTQIYYLRVRGQDFDENFSEYSYDYAAPSGDRAPPTSPANITWTRVSNKSVRLTWSASTDNIGVDSYSVGLSSISHTTPTTINIGNITEHVFEGLSGGTTYYVKVGVRDLANNKSSNYIQFFFPGVPPPENLRLSTLTSKKLKLSWSGATQGAGVTGYLVDLSTKSDFSSFVGNYQSQIVGNVTSFDFVNLTPGTQYFARVFAVNAMGNRSTPSVVETATTSPAGPPPPAPSKVTMNSLGTGKLFLVWRGVVDGTEAGYLVDLSTSADFSSYVGPNHDLPWSPYNRDITFSGLDPSKIHFARVRARNLNDDYSPYSHVAYAIPSSDTESPTSPGNYNWIPVSGTSVRLNWSPSTDNVGVVAYYLDLSLEPNFNTYVPGYDHKNIGADPQHLINGLVAGKRYYARAYARDLAGQETTSVPTSFVFNGLADTEPPQAPGDLHVHYRQPTALFVRWYEPPDNRRVSGYMLDVATDETFHSLVPGYGSQAYGVEVGGAGVVVQGLQPSTSYHIRVRARDAAGNISANSPTVRSMTRPTASTPSAPTGLTLVPAYQGLTLQWRESDDDMGQTYYLLDVSTSPVFNSYVGGYRNLRMTAFYLWRQITGLQPGTRYYVRLRAEDGDGLLSSYSTTVNAVAGSGVRDTQAPTSPSSVQITHVTPTEFYFRWEGSVDNVGVSNYVFDVATDAQFLNRIPGMDGQYLRNEDRLGYRITGLTPSRPCYLRIRAMDFSENVSSNSASLRVETRPASEAPTVPTGLSLLGTTRGMIQLSWTAANDNRGIHAYYVDVSTQADFSSFVGEYQNMKIGLSPTMRHIGGLIPGTRYYVRLRAGDGENNTSANSAVVSGTAGN